MKTNAETTQNEATAAAVAEQGATTEPKQASAKTRANKKKGAPKAKKAAGKSASKKDAMPASKKASKAKDAPARVPREFSKKQIVLDLLRRKDGATLPQIADATGWQKHYADVRIMPTCVGNPVCGAGIAAMESA